MYYLIFPSKHLKEHYIERYKKRESPEALIKIIEDNFNDWVDECSWQKGCIKIVLDSEKDTLKSCIDSLYLKYFK